VTEAKHAILVVDDNDIDRANMTSLLVEAGYVVRGLPSPIGATRAARTLGAKLVIIDQNLPAMDGSKLALLLRGTPALRELRLILVSGHDDPAMHELAERVKADAYVSKRDLHEQLVATVRRVLLR